MPYDFDLLEEHCREIGLIARHTHQRTLEVPVGDGAVLCFQNADREEDCLLGFLDTPWHAHGDLMFADGQGNYIEMDSLDLLSGLKAGKVLICEQEVGGQLVDRWLAHSDLNDEFGHLGPSERIIVRRAFSSSPETVTT